MEYIYAALLLHKSGKQVDEEGVKRVLAAAGMTPEETRVKSLVAALSEINIDEVLKQASFAPAAASPVTSAQPTKQEKVEKKEEKEEKKEEALAGLSALFG